MAFEFLYKSFPKLPFIFFIYTSKFVGAGILELIPPCLPVRTNDQGKNLETSFQMNLWIQQNTKAPFVFARRKPRENPPGEKKEHINVSAGIGFKKTLTEVRKEKGNKKMAS